MRILHVIQRYVPAHGGAEQHLHEIGRRLVQDGHAVVTITSDARDVVALWDPRGARFETQHEVIDGVEIYRFSLHHAPGGALTYAAVRRLLWLYSKTPFPLAPAYLLSHLTPRIPGLFRWLRETPAAFDVVAAMTIVFEPLVYEAWQYAQRRGIPFLLYPLTHLGAGSRPGRDDLASFYTMRHQVALVQQADVVFAQTPDEADFYAAHGVERNRLVIAGAGVNPEDVLGGDATSFRERFGIGNRPLVGMIGTLSHDKGANALLEAALHLWDAGEDFVLALAGFMPVEFMLRLESVPSHWRSRMLVLGVIDNTLKRHMLAALDVFVLPSRSDSFGIAFLEAWLYGKPVIGAHVWGVRTLIAHERDGLLVPFGDPWALAQAIKRLLDNPNEATAMGQRGRAKVAAKHLWAHVYARVRPHYTQSF